jgi:hypothetical protein
MLPYFIACLKDALQESSGKGERRRGEESITPSGTLQRVCMNNTFLL